MTARTVTLSSAGVSAFVNLDWGGGKPAVASLVLASSQIAIDYTLQATLYDLQTSSSPVWFNCSSGGFGSNGAFPSLQGT